MIKRSGAGGEGYSACLVKVEMKVRGNGAVGMRMKLMVSAEKQIKEEMCKRGPEKKWRVCSGL